MLIVGFCPLYEGCHSDGPIGRYVKVLPRGGCNGTQQISRHYVGRYTSVFFIIIWSLYGGFYASYTRTDSGCHLQYYTGR